MPLVVSSTLPSLGTARPGRSFVAPKAPLRPQYESVEILELLDGAPAAEMAHDDAGPSVVCGYTIGPLLARGGLSVVFEVTHPDLSEPLAMKVITDPRIQHDLAADVMYAHASTIATLASPHVVRTFDAGRLPSGEPFVVMERLDGEDLEKQLRVHGPLPVADAVRFVIEACEGLAEAHEAGVVHGDIKPANLVIVAGERGPFLKIIDFAPSVPRASHPEDPLVTCSPGYASPEQLGARPNVDGRADVWALGAVLFELVTGTRAFDATTLPDMLKIIGRVPPPMRLERPEVPAALDIVVRRCLARDREMRFEGVLQLRAALAQAMAPSMAAARVATRRRTRAPRIGRVLFFAALGPASALLSMTLVRLVMASSLMSSPAPPRWPAPIALTESTAEPVTGAP
jgi:serine/threonine-protein kinase